MCIFKQLEKCVKLSILYKSIQDIQEKFYLYSVSRICGLIINISPLYVIMVQD